MIIKKVLPDHHNGILQSFTAAVVHRITVSTPTICEKAIRNAATDWEVDYETSLL